MNVIKQIYKLVSQVPKGKVTTYKLIAQKLGIKNPRFIGFVLHRNKNPNKIPCHRVIKSSGKLANGYAFGGMREQKRKLEKEGVEIVNNSINLEKHIFTPH